MPSFPELGRNSEFMVILLLIMHCFVSLQICEDVKLIIITFYNCDFKLYFSDGIGNYLGPTTSKL